MDEIARQIERLTHHDPFIRQDAARTLGVHGDARAVEPLIAALHDIHPEVRRAATAALGRLGDARAIAPLIAIVRERENALRRAAGAALMAVADPVGAAQAYRGDFREVAPRLKALREGRTMREGLTPSVTFSLGRPAGGDEQIALLVETLVDQDTTIPWLAAAEALGQIAERSPRPELRGALSCLRALAECALSPDQRDVCWSAARKIEDMTLPLMDLPLPASAPPLPVESLPRPAAPSPSIPDGLPVASVGVPDGGAPTERAARRGWRQWWARAARRGGDG